MLNDITFGQYYDSNSVLHRLDPRTKLCSLLIILVFLFLINNIIGIVFGALFVVSLILLSKVPFKMYLKNIKAIWVIIVFTSVMNLFYSTQKSHVLVQFWKLTITESGLNRAVLMSVRIILLVLISSILTYVTTPNDLTDGIESLLKPLKFIGLGGVVHTLAMMTTIALRFIPTLVRETEKIMNAQKARGADIDDGKLGDRIKALIPILIPLLISSVRRAYELAEAMECRCYNGGVGKQRMKQLKMSSKDLWAFCVTLLFCGAVIILRVIF